MDRWTKLATLGKIGYMPASGTIATFATLPLVILMRACLSLQTQLIAVACITIVSFFIVHKAQQAWPWIRDPRQIVLDELVGCLWAFCGIQLTVSKLFVGFLLFRFFDIVKPLGISACEGLPGAWGVMLDDILAGNYTLICLLLLYA